MISSFSQWFGASIRPFFSIVTVGIFVVSTILVWYFFASGGSPAPLTMTIQKSDFTQQVSVSGTVVARDTAELGFSQTGRIAKLYATVGDQVMVGDLIAEIENNDVRATIAQRNAILSRARAELSSLKAGAREEDVAVSAATVTAAETSLVQARLALANAIGDAYRAADDAVRVKSDQFFSNARTSFPQLNFITTDSQLKNDLESERAALEKVLDAWNERVQSLSADTTLDESVASARTSITRVQNYLNKASAALAQGVSSQSVSSAQLQSWGAETNISRTSVNATLTTLTTAVTSKKSAETTLAREKKSLTLKEAPATPANIEALEAAVRAAEADVASAVAQLKKTQITSPFSGVITKADMAVGEIASANASVITLMSSGTYQIEAFVSEITIAQVAVGQLAVATLDAYGKSVTFDASVVHIDPARTIKDGVSTYKTLLEFKTADERIRSGMTADTVITTSRKESTFVVPSSAVVVRGSDRFLNVLIDGESVERLVSIGGKSLAETEILGGVSEGDIVLVNPAK